MPRAQGEPAGKSEPRSIAIITVTTHICRSLCCLPSALSYINSAGASLGKEVGKISLRIFPILCISRINSFKQIRNRLNEVPLVKQKSNYMMGNYNDPSQASARESQSWSQCPRGTCRERTRKREITRPPSLRHQRGSSHRGGCIRRGTRVFPAVAQGNLSFIEYSQIRLGWALGGCLHAIISFRSTIYLPGKECQPSI